MRKGSTLGLWLGSVLVLIVGLFFTLMMVSPELSNQITGAFASLRP